MRESARDSLILLNKRLDVATQFVCEQTFVTSSFKDFFCFYKNFLQTMEYLIDPIEPQKGRPHSEALGAVAWLVYWVFGKRNLKK